MLNSKLRTPNSVFEKLSTLLNTPLGIVIVVGSLITAAEFLIMLVILPIAIPEIYWGFADPILLAVIISPALYFLVFLKIQENEERFRQILVAAPDAIVIVNKQGRIADWNLAAQKMFQYSSEEAVGQQMHQLIAPPRYREDAGRGFARFEETGNGPLIGKTTEIVALRKDGSEFSIELSISAVKVRGRQHTISSIRDITERKQIELMLRERVKELTCRYAVSRDMLRKDWSMDEFCRHCVEHLVPAMQFPEIAVPIIELNGERIISGNYTEGLSHGLHAEIRVAGEALGHLRVYYAEDRPFMLPYEQSLVNSVAEAIGMWLERNRAGEALAATQCELQVSHQLLQERAHQLELSNRYRDEFLAAISHELRTPLNHILGFADLLKEDLIGELSAEQKAVAQDIFNAGSKQLIIVNSLIELARLQVGKVELQAEPEDPARMLDEIATRYAVQAKTAGLAFTIEVAEGLSEMPLDRKVVTQLLDQLLANAFKFTPAGGKVSFAARRVPRTDVTAPVRIEADEYLELTVANNGPSITPGILPRLFQPFVQGEGGLTRHYEGTGIGLALVRLLAELHGGGSGVKSEPGAGVKFIVWLPIGKQQ